jgi:serine phosphatase RsbU (regulator of sigma subunit)
VSDRPRAVTAGQNRTATATTPGRAPPAATPATTRAATATTPGRRTISDRQRGGEATGTRSNLTPVKGRSGARPRGMRLRMKFMLVLSGITALAMVLLGLTMSFKANKYLFSQKQHDGIEVARMAAELGSVVTDQMRLFDAYHREHDDLSAPATIDARKKLINNLEAYIAEAVQWPDVPGKPTDVLAVAFDTPGLPELSAHGYGPRETGSSDLGSKYQELFLPKNGDTVRLPEGIQVYASTKHIGDGQVQIYRFKIALDPQRFGNGANVRVDVDASGVDNVRNNLSTAIALAVVLAIGLVIGVANWLAGNITRPVQILLKDMQVVARGNLDHQTKPHSSDEIGVLAHEFNKMTENLKEAQSALVEQEKAEYELSIAREVQKQLLPAEPPLITGFECADYYQGAKAVSGDYYDFIPLGNGLWGFIVADVSGKGIPGSMVMAVTRTIVRLIALRNQARAAETLKETNRLIAKQIKRGMFVTSFYAVLDERSGQLAYASAGHNPMIIYRAASRSHELATGKGIALGFNEGPIFDKTIEEHRTVLQSGDAILLYTDGFPEAMNAQNQEFGDDRFYQLVGQLGHLDARSLIERLVAAIAKHRGEAEQSDDLTLIAVRRA